MPAAREMHIKASPERVVEEMKAAIDLPVVTVDPNHGIGQYEDHVGWQFIGHVSSDGFKVIRRYRPGSRPSQMFMSWNPGTNGSIYAPALMGRIREEENGTLLLMEFKRNPSFWLMPIFIAVFGSILLGIIITIGLLEGEFSITNLVFLCVFLIPALVGNSIVAFDTESEDKQALMDWLSGIQERAESTTLNLPLRERGG